MIIKPCKKCIVRATCKEPCYKINDRLIHLKKRFHNIDLVLTVLLALVVPALIIYTGDSVLISFLSAFIVFSGIKIALVIIWGIYDHKFSKRFGHIVGLDRTFLK